MHSKCIVNIGNTLFQAMGDFPYPSGYMLNGHGELPAYPMRTACQPLSQQGLTGPALLQGLRQAVGTFYNFSGSLPCFNYTEGPNPETDDDSNFWDYQACTEMVMPFSRNGGAVLPPLPCVPNLGSAGFSFTKLPAWVVRSAACC